MRRIISLLIAGIFCAGFFVPLSAQEKVGLLPLIAVSKEARTKLKKAQKIGIFLNSNDALLKRIVEDALAIELANAGFMNINREVLEKGVGDQIAKKRKDKTEEALNALDVGKAVNADFILTGTVVIESGESQSLLVKIASLQMVDTASGETLINAVFEPQKGKTFSEVAKSFVEILKQNTR